jgi:hypothetical protein
MADTLVPGRKRCRRCGVVRMNDSYGRDPTQPDCRRRTCNPCRRDVRTAWRASHPDGQRLTKNRYQQTRSKTATAMASQGRTLPTHKTCSRCHGYLTAARFRVMPGSADGLASECKRCRSESG